MKKLHLAQQQSGFEATFGDMAVSACVFTVGFVGRRGSEARYLFSRSGGCTDFMINMSTQICE